MKKIFFFVVIVFVTVALLTLYCNQPEIFESDKNNITNVTLANELDLSEKEKKVLDILLSLDNSIESKNIVLNYLRKTEPITILYEGYDAQSWQLGEYEIVLTHERKLKLKNGSWTINYSDFADGEFSESNAVYIWNNSTCIIQNSELQRWILGIKNYVIRLPLLPFAKIENDIYINGKTHFIVVFGKKLGIVNWDGYLSSQIDDYSGLQYAFNSNSNSLYYINQNLELIRFNVITEESQIIDRNVFSINTTEDSFSWFYTVKGGESKIFSEENRNRQ